MGPKNQGQVLTCGMLFYFQAETYRMSAPDPVFGAQPSQNKGLQTHDPASL